MGNQGCRADVGGLERGFPGHDRMVATQLEVHAGVCGCLEAARNCASAACTIAVVPSFG